LNRSVALASAGLICAAGLRALASAEPPAPRPPDCANRVLAGDGVSTWLSCNPAFADGERVIGGVDSGRMAGPALRLLGLPVDLNRSSVEDLQALPGIGPKLAERIAGGRPYRCPSELKQVEGIGPKRWAELRSAVTVDPKRRLCADHL
jgi:competence protein ComEA